MWFHFVSRAEHPHRPFDQRIHCVKTWWRLKKQFPRAYACILMPNHVHMILETDALADDWRRFRAVTGQVPVPWQAGQIPSKPIPDSKHLWRQIRYVHLNPCRARICLDPLQWEWSTYQDYMGAAWPQWPDLDRVRSALGWRNGSDWEATIHRLTSPDPTVAVAGTAPPLFERGIHIHNASFPAVCAAAARAFRQMPERFQKRCPERAVIVRLAEGLEGVDIYEFARHFGITIRGLLYMRQRKISPGMLRALSRTLSDRRLMPPPASTNFALGEIQAPSHPRFGG